MKYSIRWSDKPHKRQTVVNELIDMEYNNPGNDWPDERYAGAIVLIDMA